MSPLKPLPGEDLPAPKSPLKAISSERLLERLIELVRRSSDLEADLLEHLAEVDARRLYLQEGCPSMFAYCVRVLRFAEAVAYKRIAAMRAARRHPDLLTNLRSGELHLTALSLLAPQLTAGNAAELIAAARHRTADEIRRMLADRKPQPDLVSSVRKLPAFTELAAKRPAESDSVPQFPLSVSALPRSRAMDATAGPPIPLGRERYIVRFTANRELHTQLRELQALMRHQIPDGDLGKILARAVGVLLKQVRSQKFGECSVPRTERSTDSARSRHIPAAIRRAVAKRDDERCAFVSEAGRRCDSREFLEFHHCDAWARSRSHTIEGISLRCRAHNQYEAERDFGAEHMNGFRERDRPGSASPASPKHPVPNHPDARQTAANHAAANQRAGAPSQLDLNPVDQRPERLGAV
jgi:hypothetical protein